MEEIILLLVMIKTKITICQVTDKNKKSINDSRNVLNIIKGTKVTIPFHLLAQIQLIRYHYNQEGRAYLEGTLEGRKGTENISKVAEEVGGLHTEELMKEFQALGSLSENSCSPHGYQSQKRKDQRPNTNVAKSDISHHSSFSVADVPSLLPLSSGDTIHGSQSFYSYGNKNANEGDMHSTSSSSSTHCSNALRSMIPNKKHANANFHNYHSREDSDSFLSASGIVSSSIYSDPSSGCSDDKTVHSYCLTQSSFKPDRYFNNSTFLGDSRLAVHRYETSSESEDRDPESESSWGDDVAEKSFLDYLETQGDLKRSEVTLESESNSKPSNPQFKTKFSSPKSKRKEWLLRMNRKISEIPVGDLDPNDIPLNALMNAWAKTKSNEGASMVEMLLNRAQAEVRAGNNHDGVQLSTKMYTMAVDAWAKSGEGENGAKRAEAILHHMNKIYISGYQYHLKPTTGIFNAVINAWARSNSANAPKHAEEIMEWMNTLYQNGNADVRPDKYTFNTVMHAWAKSGGKEAAVRAQKILDHMHHLYEQNEFWAKPDTITYNVVINAWAKSGCDSAANEAETLLRRMHFLYDRGNLDIKPNVVTYGAVIDAYAKSLEVGAASKADQLLANMIKLYQSDPKINVDLRPNTFIFNTVINCWAKSEEEDSASKAEEMLVAMGTLYQNGIPDIKPDAFTYTAVIDAWAKSGYQGAASRADKLLKEMESKYIGGETDLKPNTFTYNAVINALAKSGEAGAAGRAEQVLQNMVNRYNNGGSNDAKPTTINFNTVLDAWAKSGGGTAAAERSEKILEWMYELHGSGNVEVQPDTITFNAVIDAWARSGDKKAPVRAEQILHYMNQLYSTGNKGVKPDSYTYNTLINSWAKSGDKGAAKRASEILSEMQLKYEGGDTSVKPNTRTYTSVIDAWAKSGESMAAKKAEQILIRMQALYERSFDDESKPNSHTANAVMNACAFTKIDADKSEALSIAFRTFDWLTKQERLEADAYTFTIMLSVCSNLLPRQDRESRYAHASNLFMRCCDSGHVNDFVLRKLRQTVTEEEYMSLVRYGSNMTASKLPRQW
eukprot:CAMPEP_0184872710 /NCGR_PEP_ID=MMETSP0580-20130426/41443_1 /TAXON_ID=1118495 /ORGANISM="Dactyliosolen fragilissimus" /LENGTH=1065 /DNA_ID=CAMNT_0027375545 /DNA_START=1022 /DNA_END=4215 /DNA_ORIENTATION=+